MLDQSRAPILEALEEMKQNRLVPFDVPGHKHGKGNPPTFWENSVWLWMSIR